MTTRRFRRAAGLPRSVSLRLSSRTLLPNDPPPVAGAGSYVCVELFQRPKRKTTSVPDWNVMMAYSAPALLFSWFPSVLKIQADLFAAHPCGAVRNLDPKSQRPVRVGDGGVADVGPGRRSPPPGRRRSGSARHRRTPYLRTLQCGRYAAREHARHPHARPHCPLLADYPRRRPTIARATSRVHRLPSGPACARVLAAAADGAGWSVRWPGS